MLWFLCNSSNYSCGNFSSITRQQIGDAMSARLSTEIEEGILTIVGDECVCTHALGSVPKGHDDFRAIVDCSSPVGVCVNEHTWSCRMKFCYSFVDRVTKIMQHNDALTTVDISNACRQSQEEPGVVWIMVRDLFFCMITYCVWG